MVGSTMVVSTMEGSAMEDSVMEDLTMEDLTMEDSTTEGLTMEDSTMEDSTMEDLIMEDTTMEDLTMDIMVELDPPFVEEQNVEQDQLASTLGLDPMVITMGWQEYWLEDQKQRRQKMTLSNLEDNLMEYFNICII